MLLVLVAGTTGLGAEPALAAPQRTGLDLAGSWQLDKKKSDDFSKVIKRALQRSAMPLDRSGQALLMTTLSRISALQAPVLRLEQQGQELQFIYPDQRIRIVYTDARPASVSLSGAARGQDEVVIAGWEQGRLAVESTLGIDLHVTEYYERLPGDTPGLKQTVILVMGGLPKPLTLQSLYREMAPDSGRK